MKKGWKIALISIGSLLGVVVIVVLVALWLVFTPSQLTKIVNKLAGQYVQCEAHFESVDLTLLRTFPDAGLKVGRVYLVNPTEGAQSDTVASIGGLTVGVDVKKFIKEKEIIVHQVLLDDVRANLYINKEGQSNFDIFATGGDEDTNGSGFNLDSLPNMDLKKISINNMCAALANERDGMEASVDGVGMKLVGSLREGRVEADLDVEGNGIELSMVDSSGATTLAAQLYELCLGLNAKGNTEGVDGKLKLKADKGRVKVGEVEMVNETLQQSQKDLLTLTLPFRADLKQMKVRLDDSRLKIDDYALNINGDVQLEPMTVDVDLATDGSWQVEPLLQIVPQQFVGFAKDMDVDAKVELRASAIGTLTDSTMPVVDAQVQLVDGRFYMPSALPYKINRIKAGLDAHLDMGKDGRSHAVINNFTAHTRCTDISISGRADDLMGDMHIDAAIRGTMPLDDVRLMLPDTLPLEGKADVGIDLKVNTSMSVLQAMALEKVKASGTVRLKDVDITFDSIHAICPGMDIAMRMPAIEHKGCVADAHVSTKDLRVRMPRISGNIENPDINVGINNPIKEQVAASFDISLGESEANMDSLMVSFGALNMKGSVRLDSTQTNVLRQYNPVVDIDMHSAVLYMPELPDAVRLSQFTFAYSPETCELSTAEVKLGHSDFQLYGTVENLEQWVDKKEILRADLNFTSGYADVDQLMDMFSGVGSNADTLEQMREEDNVPAEANPFIVPRDVDLTLHTHIQRSVAFGNDLNDVAGALTINDGVAVLDQMGFVCKAATMQLTALYKSPRPNNLFVALDFHLLDIQIDELLDMIPAVDTLVPMLAAFNGNANFHLAGETFLDAKYSPKMSSLLGSAAISGKDLVVMDNSSIAQIAKLMQFKSWKDKDDKIKIDSLDVELTCFRKEIEVYPFLLNIGKYQLCASGKHTLDNNCGYHVELLKNPLMTKVGVDVRGNLSSPKISLGEVRYADLYKPEKQGVVEKQTLELKRMIKEALEANVR